MDARQAVQLALASMKPVEVARQVKAADSDDEELSLGEIKVAEYVIFLLAFDTYIRYVEETTQQDDPTDDVIQKGLRLLRVADTELEALQQFLNGHLPSDVHKRMLMKAVSLRAANSGGVGRRALMMRTLLSRGGATTMRAVFENNRMLKQVREAIAASMLDDADAALDLFAKMLIRNARLRDWIDLAADTAGSGTLPANVVEAGASEAQDQKQDLLTQNIEQLAASGADASRDAQEAQSAKLVLVQEEATAAARKALEQSGEPDEPLTKSEVVGVAVAAAAAAVSDASNPQNIPEPLRGLDNEQRAAALTDGRVGVFAGAGSGKCLHGDTLVRTGKGWIPIREFAEGLVANEERSLKEYVQGLEGPELTSVILNNGHRQTVRITTRLGYTIEGTHNHPLWVLRDGTLQWVPMGELQDSDYLCIDRRPGLFAEEAFVRPERSFEPRANAQPPELPRELTPQVASLLGYVVSEGHVIYGPHASVRISTTDPDQLRLYEQAVEGVVPSAKTHRYTKTPRLGVETVISVVGFGRRSNVEALADFGVSTALAHEKEVPFGVLRSPKLVVRAFLRALFDGDGGFHSNTISYGSASRKLSSQVHELLLGFGVVSRLKFKPNKKRGSWEVLITGEDARTFLREVGFNLEWKQKSAEEALDKTPNTNLDVFPGLSGLFHEVFEAAKAAGQLVTDHPKFHAFKCYRMGTRNPSRQMLGEFLEAYPTNCSAHRALSRFHQEPWFFDSIDRVLNSEADVYDFVVPETHSFSAGGFVNHNSTTLVARVAYLVKDRRVNPSRVLVTSFNVKAASELKEKIGRSAGADALQQMSVGTMHGLFRKFIMEFGTPAEKISMGAGFVEAGNAVAFAVQRIWEECYGKERPVPKLKTATMNKARWAGNDISPAQAQAEATTMEDADSALWYGIYEGLKGTAGNWRPPCPSKAYESFMAKWRSRADRLGDFTDMLKIYRDILKRNPAVRAKVQGMFDHIIVDEAQDRNTLMAEIIDMMSEHIGDGSDGKSVWIVGDDKQAINSFQGAKAKLFKDLYQKEGWKTRVIRTNYRCEPEIVDCANKLIAHNDGNVPIPQMPAPDRKPGNGSVQVHIPSDEVDAALMAVQEIKQNHVLGGDYTDHAVLCRTNKELHSYETACIIRGVPYARRGASSFLGSPETKAVLGYVQLVTGNDFTKGQAALGSVINNPNRFFLSDPKKAPEAVENAFSQYARIIGTDAKSIDPMKAMKDRSFIRVLADHLAKLTRTGKGFKFEEKIEDLGYGLDEIRARSNTEGYTTKDLFDEILSLEGVAIDNGVFKPQTFRESLKVSLRDAMGDEDAAAAEEEEEDDDTKGLGNVSFLYQLAKPDPTDEADEITPPTTPHGFAAKMARYASKMRDLRTDIDKWLKDQAALPPEQRRPPPGVYVGTVHCSPADEPVLTTSGWVPIGDLDPETHRLASYTPHCNQLFWGRKKGNHEGPDGYGFQKARNFFKGTLLTLTTERSKTRVTPDHKIRVKWAESFHNKYVVYLMRRGDWWRVGHCKSCPRPYKAGDLGSRLATEKADGGWILKVCETKEEAIIEEVRIQGIFGIPGTTFEATKARAISSSQLHAVHEGMKHVVAPRAKDLLAEFGLSPEYPLYHGGPDRESDKRESFTIQARNCLSGYMLLPVVSEAFIQPSGTRETWTKPEWHRVSVTTEPFEGDVFSLVVWPHHFYVSGGAIVHNSVKGAQWKTTFVQMPKGKFPIMFKPKPGDPPPDPEKEKERIEDERRLAYVALTRAAKSLRVLCPKAVGGKAAGISEFVDEADLNIGENVQRTEGAEGPEGSEGFPKEASLYNWEEGHDA